MMDRRTADSGRAQFDARAGRVRLAGFRRTTLTAGLAACLCLALPPTGSAGDHFDSPLVRGADKLADLGGLFAWMSEDAAVLNVAVTTFPYIYEHPTRRSFGTEYQYAVHVSSAPALGVPAEHETLLCQFYAPHALECWLGGEYVVGDPSAPHGIQSSSGKLRVFAGVRKDPFLIDIPGFKATVAQVSRELPAMIKDEHGCPLLSKAESNGWVATFQGNGATPPGPAVDTFEEREILALVFAIDKTLVNRGGPVLGLWSSTHLAPGGERP